MSEIGPSSCTDTVRFVREGDTVLLSLAATVYTKGLLTFYGNGTCPLLWAGFSGRAWQNNSKWYTKPPELLCNSMYIIYKCGLGSHGTTRRDTRPAGRGLETHGLQRFERKVCKG